MHSATGHLMLRLCAGRGATRHGADPCHGRRHAAPAGTLLSIGHRAKPPSHHRVALSRLTSTPWSRIVCCASSNCSHRTCVPLSWLGCQPLPVHVPAQSAGRLSRLMACFSDAPSFRLRSRTPSRRICRRWDPSVHPCRARLVAEHSEARSPCSRNSGSYHVPLSDSAPAGWQVAAGEARSAQLQAALEASQREVHEAKAQVRPSRLISWG